MERKQKIKRLFLQIPEIKFSYLFGSYVKSQMGPLSDIDIAVYLETSINDFDSHLSIHHQLSKTLRQKVDLIILNEVKNLFLIESIIKEGVIITDSDDDTRLYYETMMLHRILDYKHFKKMIDAA